MSLLKALATVSGMTLLSRVLGFIRDLVIARVFGAGLATDAQCRVLTKDRQPVPGLYAVGNDAASVMGGNYPGAGITLGPCVTFGYTAAMHLAGAAARPAQATEPAARLAA